MRKLMIIVFGTAILFSTKAQLRIQYDPALEPVSGIQYFKPRGNLFVGDCIPFYHDKTYYLYWLLDSAHHAALGGLGGHQWVLSTSKDLVTWKHYPVVLGIDEDWEKSICTGSVVYYHKKFYAFYATRLLDSTGKKNEQLSYAISDDGIHFVKQKPNPFYTSAPGYSKRNFRDPKVVVDSAGQFHLFVSSSMDSSITNDKGALVHLQSADLKSWSVLEPVIYGQHDVPECPDYFFWKGWYYLIYGRGGNTFYLKSKNRLGPWEYPRYQALNEDWVNVAKTAEFNNGRRIVAGWIPNRRNNADTGREIFGGNIVLRELTQEEDGTLNTRFPQEVLPVPGKLVPLNPAMGPHVIAPAKDQYAIRSPGGEDALFFKDIPQNCSIDLQIRVVGPIEEYGLYLRTDFNGTKGYKLSFKPSDREVGLASSKILGVEGLTDNEVHIIMKQDIIDVCVGNKRCIVNRLYEQKGGFLGLYCKHGEVVFDSIRITSSE